MKAVGFEQDELFRWSALLNVAYEEGINNLKVIVLRPKDLGHTERRYIVFRVSRFVTMFRMNEANKIIRRCSKIDSMTGAAQTLLQSLQKAYNDALEDQERAKGHSRMI